MWRENNKSSLARAMAGQKSFLPGPPDGFCSFFNVNEEYERCSYSVSYESYPRSGYWQQLEFQRDYLLRSQVAKATLKTQAKRNLPKITSCCRAENQEQAAWKKIFDGLNACMKYNKILN